MDAQTQQIVTLFMYFGGVLLCFIRRPQGGRLHLALCAAAAALWAGCWFLEPGTHRWLFVATTLSMLAVSTFLPSRQRTDVPH
jgi:hypothetical protein